MTEITIGYMKSTVDEIDPSNKALKYLKKRIADDSYRGNIGSQHNRWDFDELIVILRAIDKHAPVTGLMQTRNTDISKRPGNIAGEFEYAAFCNEVKTLVGKGTQDSIRKNLFPDFHRAGWITRFDKDGNELDPYGSGGVLYVALSEEGKKLINTEKLIDQYFIFSKGVDKFLGGAISKILHLLSDGSNAIDYVDLLEMTFFVSAVGAASPDVGITIAECRDLILEFRKMSKLQRIGVDAHLTRELVPNPNSPSKTEQRDYHNWINASQQAFAILKQTVYFEVRTDLVNSHFNRIVWMQKTESGRSEEEKRKAAEIRLKRSLQEKNEYFKQHNVVKKKGFELHHVVALAWAESEHHFKLLDSWKNMVYIDGYNHAKITQNRNLNVQMKIEESDIILTDYSNNKVELFFPKDVIWDPQQAHTLQTYNDQLLKFVEVNK